MTSLSRREIRITAEKLCWPHSVDHEVTADMELAANTISGLMGASGAGKSTLLKACSGWSDRLAGSIRIQFPETQHPARDGTVHDTVLMPQDSMDLILPWYQVQRNLEIAASFSKIPTPLSVVQKFASLLGLTQNHMKRHPKEISGGERRRLALGMAILRGARLLLLDEPFTGLDFDLRIRLWDVIHKAVKLPHLLPIPVFVESVLLTSHSIEDVSCLCDKTYVIHRNGSSCVTRESTLSSQMPSALFSAARTDEIAGYEVRLRDTILSCQEMP